VIIGYNFFGLEEGCFWDTPICTDMLDELQLNEGVYDEVYVNLDTNIVDDTAKPQFWSLTTIMDAKFTGDLDAGSIGADGFTITKIQLYRSVYGTNKWDAIGEFDYNPDFNVYDYVDRYVQNGAVYQYAIVPVANEVLGDMLRSDTIKAEFEGIFITDKKENRRLEYDISLGEIAYNTNSALNQPINSKFPVVTFGQSNYRSGTLSVLPLSKETIELAGSGIDKLAEQVNRQEWLDFLNNGKAKVLRMDNGVIMLIVTQNARVQHKDGDLVRDLATITFDFVEIGEINFDMLVKNNLIPTAYLSKSTFDDFGGIISG
jgi:hypothetical protein